LAHMRRRALPYLRRRVFWACRMRCRIIRRSPLKHVCRACEGGISRSGWSSSRVIRPRVSKPRRGGGITVRSGSDVLTLLHRDMWVTRGDWSPAVACCGLGLSLTRRLLALARLRILATSCLTELGQRWRGRDPREGAGAVRQGNMVIALSIASPMMDWRWLVRSRMCAVASCGISLCPPGETSLEGDSRDSSSERAMALTNVVAECDPTAT
jgi:hypothetical protein